MAVPEVLYKLSWKKPGGPALYVLGVYAAVSEVWSTLVDAGATDVELSPLTAAQDRDPASGPGVRV